MDLSKVVELQKGALLLARSTLANQDKEIKYLRYLVSKKDFEILELKNGGINSEGSMCAKSA